MKSLRPIKTTFGQRGTLHAISSHARQLESLQRIIQACLNEPMCSHVQLANYRNSLLILQTDSPVWASKLRYLVPELIKQCQLHPSFQSLRDIRILVAPFRAEAKPVKRPQPRLSAASRQLLESTAENITDPELKASLLRLSRRGDKS
jgi:hypothetical protein